MGNSNRRVFPRHVLGNSSLILCQVGSGEVIDISESGLGFTPLTFREWPKQKFKIDLLLNEPDISILNITCSIVHPDPPQNENHTRCGLTFHDMTAEQKKELQYFCDHYKLIPLTP